MGTTKAWRVLEEMVLPLAIVSDAEPEKPHQDTKFIY
jgi:hypothetical protein